MTALLNELENEHQAFVTGTSFNIQFYETQDGTRFARQRDGSYQSGAVSYPSFADLLEGTLGPISAGQLYALVAVYHPLVTARVSPDREPERMSRSEARAYILDEYADITPFDLSMESGTLSFAPKAGRLAARQPAPRKQAPPPPPPPPPPPQPRELRLVLEVTCLAPADLSEEAAREALRGRAERLLGGTGDAGLEVTVIGLAAPEALAEPA